MAGIYIHIPFCKQACYYCNFYFSTSLANKQKFIKALLAEIELSKDFMGGESIETIYFGGGTPSQFMLDDFKLIIEKITTHYDLSGLKEFTIEANPDDLTPLKVGQLSKLRDSGFNRFSIGVQSFFEIDLKYMNRAHNAEEGLLSVQRVQRAGFDNITIDLIYGTPTLSDDNLKKNLETAFKLQVPHLSAYALTVEPKTPLERRIRRAESKPVEEEQTARQFMILMDEMKKEGFEQYEISNFARPGHDAVHNSNYWLGRKYLGLGPSAHSFNGISRRWNVANTISYIHSLEQRKISFEEEVLTQPQMVNEKIMTSLRTQWGLKLSDCGLGYAERIKNSLKKIEPSFYTIENEVIKLTTNGKLFADSIASQLFIDPA